MSGDTSDPDIGLTEVGWEKLPEKYRTAFNQQTTSDLSKFPKDWPELELLPLAAALAPVPDASNYASLTIAVLTTTSRGTVTINSTDTNDNPIVDPQWLTTETDKQLAIQALKRGREIFNATGLEVGDEIYPGPAVQTDEQILAYIQYSLAPIHHAASTCTGPLSSPQISSKVHPLTRAGKMGKKGDTSAVVDPKGLVYGVSNLRIVDASVFPLLPPGHPQATVCESRDPSTPRRSRADIYQMPWRRSLPTISSLHHDGAKIPRETFI